MKNNLKILSLGSDNTILDHDSRLAKRVFDYADLTNKYTLVVPNNKDKEVEMPPKIKVFGIGGCCKVVTFFRMLRKCCEILNEEHYDVVTTQDPFELGFLGWLLTRKYHIGLNVQEHGDFFSCKYWKHESLRNFFRYYLGIFVIKRADSVRVVSNRIKNTLVNKLGINPEKIVCVPIFVENKVTLQSEVCKEFEGKFVFLSMARFVKQKNLELMIRAFAKVSGEHDKAVLLLVGKGPDKKELVELVNELKIQDRVFLKDWTDCPEFYYSNANAYLLSSNYEGWGMVIVEAARFGLPIVMTDVGCAEEVIKNQESGLVVPSLDVTAFAKDMEIIMNDENLRRKIGMAAKNAVQNLPDFPSTLNLYLESWLKALK